MRTATKLGFIVPALLLGSLSPLSTVQAAPTGETPKASDNPTANSSSPATTGTTDPKAEGNDGKRTGTTPGAGGPAKGTSAPR